ncbi:MAG: hypothetical protein MI784_15240 [Cytophagales bacterium]|nr:hypothetical protein [Cytophagales bacterium]
MKEVPMSPKKQPFETPENYFYEFNERLQKRIRKERQPEKPKVRKSIWLYASSSAAAAVIVGLFITLLNQEKKFEKQQEALEIGLFEEIPDEEIINYLSNSDVFMQSFIQSEGKNVDEFTFEEYETLYNLQYE